MTTVSSSFESSRTRPVGGVVEAVKQSVIAARVQANDGRRSEAAEPVGFQPFPRERQIQPGANTLIEANHF